MMNIETVDLGDISLSAKEALTTRSAVPDDDTRLAAAAIVREVRDHGDEALVALGKQHGGAATSDRLLVEQEAIEAAFVNAAPEFVDALGSAIAAIRIAHKAQLPQSNSIETSPGVSIDRRWSPVRRVGVYVPGGGASYPSSLLMGAIPAQVAGVREIAIVCPAAADGAIDPSVLVAAHMLGLSEVYAAGGAQAIGALAYGTESIPRVQKIVGPGGAWVTAAKLAVYGSVGIDLPAGPSESAVIIDSTTPARIAAADLLCQAEHGPDSVVVLVTADRSKAEEVLVEVSRQIERLDRRKILRESLDTHGLVVIAEDHRSALAFTDEWAPEHVSILTAQPRRDSEMITAAGSVLIGTWTPESAGDYATGANHILPTGGLAAACGPLGTEDFGSWRQVQEVTRDGLERIAPTIRTLSLQEGLSAHAACVDERLERTEVGASL